MGKCIFEQPQDNQKMGWPDSWGIYSSNRAQERQDEFIFGINLCQYSKECFQIKL